MNQTGILDLSIYDFVQLTTFLDASSKYNLSRTCRYLQDIMNNPLIWNQSDEIKVTCLSSKEEATYLVERMPKKTRKVLFRGKLQEVRYLPLNFFEKLCSFDNLTVLALERISFDELASDINGKLKCLEMKHFPPTLEELSLKGTTSIVNKHFLFSPEERPNLKVLILDECHWLNNYYLKSLNSYPNLEIISLIGCWPERSLGLSILFNAAWNLKIVDVRLASVDEGFWNCDFNQRPFVYIPMQSLQCVYFENRVLTYQCTRVLRLCVAMLNQTVNLTPPYRSSLYVDQIRECSCGYEKPSNQLLVPTDNIGRARMKLSLRNFSFVDFRCISTINLDVLDLSGSTASIFAITRQKELHPNCKIIHPNVCKCLVTATELSVDPPEGFKCLHINSTDDFISGLFNTFATLRP